MDFNEIPVDRLEPAVLLEIRANYRNVGVLPWPEKVCIIGQRLASGTLAPGVIREITRADEGISLFGRGSIGAEQVAFFKKANRNTPLFVTALADDADGVKATGSFTFAGNVASALVLRFKIGGRQVRMTAIATDNIAALAAKLAAAINADSDMVATAASAAGVVTVTSRHAGEVGNEIDLRVDTKAQPLPQGLTVTVVPMAGGSGNPDIQAVLDALTTTWFTKITHPWSDTTNVTKTVEWLRQRYLATSKLDCHAFVFKAGTYGQLTTFGNLTNSAFLTTGGLKKSPTPAWAIAASALGVASFYLTADPARQLRSLVLPGVEAPDEADQFLDEENDLLLRNGISTFDHLSDGSVTISRMITTYKQTNLGIADRAWLDIMVPMTMSRIRYDWSAYVGLMYPRSKLADDDSAGAFASRIDDDEDAGTSVVTPKRMAGSWAARCKLYGEKVWIEDVQKTLRESRFERNGDDRNRLDSVQQVRIVGNLMVFAGALEFQV
ncbi:phage tail sheath gpL-like [Rhizobium skierniewicense]|uniref:Phage tail sheath gpL-like n=1 Tax=Rhizobium skierniewicense TaxID=984260 RepID=A0A7W6C9B9_9HYPH|nr:phage tail sheath subtilisin-like domain-containing protein [Rhizobium skierniewicense]MBB3947216.1 phage tail sheath gpL-like [Rhizobium skierniewicense]